MLRQKVCQNRYRLEAKLNTGNFKAHQYRHKSSYVTKPTEGSGWKSHIPEGQKKCWTANF
jgi:hypothetical protein